MQKQQPMVVADPLLMSGTPCFRGTRVPFQTLIDHLEESSFEEFLDDFPSVTREMALTALEQEQRMDLLAVIPARLKTR